MKNEESERERQWNAILDREEKAESEKRAEGSNGCRHGPLRGNSQLNQQQRDRDPIY